MVDIYLRHSFPVGGYGEAEKVVVAVVVVSSRPHRPLHGIYYQMIVPTGCVSVNTGLANGGRTHDSTTALKSEHTRLNADWLARDR